MRYQIITWYSLYVRVSCVSSISVTLEREELVSECSQLLAFQEGGRVCYTCRDFHWEGNRWHFDTSGVSITFSVGS